MSLKRVANSPVEPEKKKLAPSGSQVGSPTTGFGSISYAEAARSPSRGSGNPRPRRTTTTINTLPVPDDGHLATTEGATRNNFTVDVLKRNGECYKGTMKRTDAFLSIFIGALGFDKEEFAGAILGYKGNPTVMFKTKSSFNIDEKFANLATFNYTKKVKTETGEIETHVYECSIRGVRTTKGGESFNATGAGSRYTWVKIQGAEYQVPPATIKKWLLQYGDLMTDLSEELEELEVSSDEEQELYKGMEMPTGIYSVQMLIKKPIPQFLPIDGKRIKIYHRGIKRMCENCFGSGHYRATCPRAKVEWMAYVDYFIMESGFEKEMFGRWIPRVNDWQIVNGQVHQENLDFLGRKREVESTRNKSLAQSAASIAKTLKEQQTASEVARDKEPGDVQGQEEKEKAPESLDREPEPEREDKEVRKLSKTVEDMTVEELEKLLSVKKRGRPSNADKKDKAAKQRELNRKKGKGGPAAE